MESCNIPFNENYFKRGGKGSSYTEEYWYGSELIFQYFIKRLKIIEKYIKQSKVVIDIGCGLAHSSHIIRSINSDSYVITIDASEVALKRAKELYGSDPQLDFIVTDTTKFPIKSNN